MKAVAIQQAWSAPYSCCVSANETSFYLLFSNRNSGQYLSIIQEVPSYVQILMIFTHSRCVAWCGAGRAEDQGPELLRANCWILCILPPSKKNKKQKTKQKPKRTTPCLYLLRSRSILSHAWETFCADKHKHLFLIFQWMHCSFEV